MCVCVFPALCAMCLVLKEAKRGQWLPWNWSYRLLGATKWVLENRTQVLGNISQGF